MKFVSLNTNYSDFCKSFFLPRGTVVSNVICKTDANKFDA